MLWMCALFILIFSVYSSLRLHVMFDIDISSLLNVLAYWRQKCINIIGDKKCVVFFNCFTSIKLIVDRSPPNHASRLLVSRQFPSSIEKYNTVCLQSANIFSRLEMLNITCKRSELYIENSVFWWAQMTLCVMPLRNFPPYIGPYVNSCGPTFGLSIQHIFIYNKLTYSVQCVFD